MFLAVFISVIIPAIAISWFASFMYAVYQPAFTPPSPWRWTFALLVPILIALYGLRKRSLNQSGAAAGLIVGFVLTISSVHFLMALLAFFIFASKATKFRSSKKKVLEVDFKEGGQRNWIQVICNGGPAALMAMFYMWEVGGVDLPINFFSLYAGSWYAVAVMSALACSSGDTFASEIGSVAGTSDPIHVITFERVPRGTNGGISLIGTFSSMFGGFLVGLSFYGGVLLSSHWLTLKECPPQWPILLYGTLAGFVGSLIDSILGATVQYSGKHKTLGCIVEYKGPDIEHISGWGILDNHSVNLVASLLTAVIVPFFAAKSWSLFV